jgi:hypothetical protein
MIALKKFILGMICGVGLTASMSAFASDTIQAYLFPVDYQFNGKIKPLPAQYTTLNYNGHAYVPLRFIAESMGAKVGYDEVNPTISVLYPTSGTVLTDEQHLLHVSNMFLEQTASGSRVKGELLLDETAIDGIEYQTSFLMYFTLTFFDEKGAQIATMDQLMHFGEGGMNPRRSHFFEGEAAKVFHSYSTVELEVKYLDKAIEEPPSMTAASNGTSIPVESGSYCWGRCVDRSAGTELVEGQTPVTVQPGSGIRLEFDTDLMETKLYAARLSANERHIEEVHNLTITAPEEKGVYVYEVDAQWYLPKGGPKLGSSTYAFIVEVEGGR